MSHHHRLQKTHINMMTYVIACGCGIFKCQQSRAAMRLAARGWVTVRPVFVHPAKRPNRPVKRIFVAPTPKGQLVFSNWLDRKNGAA
jgi:hypothetical protein